VPLRRTEHSQGRSPAGLERWPACPWAASLAVAAALATASCSSFTESQTDDLPAVARGQMIVVHLRWPGEDPLPTAERYCASLGRSPRPRTVAAYSVSYDCIREDGPAPDPSLPAVPPPQPSAGER
jgi:hypothetical protein